MLGGKWVTKTIVASLFQRYYTIIGAHCRRVILGVEMSVFVGVRRAGTDMADGTHHLD